MNIIELAKQAGMRLDKHNGGFVNQSELIRFAALVRAQALEEAAGVCDEAAMFHEAAAGSELAGELAVAIRALKEKNT